MIRFDVELRTISAANAREHWGARKRRVAAERATVAFAWLRATPDVSPPCVVRLTRVAPRRLDDDNLRSALKGVRDELAARIGVDDADPRVQWEYGQEKGRVGEYLVRVEIEEGSCAG